MRSKILCLLVSAALLIVPVWPALAVSAEGHPQVEGGDAVGWWSWLSQILDRVIDGLPPEHAEAPSPNGDGGGSGDDEDEIGPGLDPDGAQENPVDGALS